MEEKNHLGLVKRIFAAKPGRQPNDPALLELHCVNELDFEPDGLSGGPAYVVQIVEDSFEAYFAGIQVRGGKNSFYILKVGFVKAFLDSFIEDNRLS